MYSIYNQNFKIAQRYIIAKTILKLHNVILWQKLYIKPLN
jgi:hypothetical protein